MAAEEKATEPEPSLVDSLTDLPQQAWRSVVDTLDERTGLPKYPILRYVSDGADAPPPPNYIREQPMGFAPVRENDDESLPKSYEDAVAMTEFVCEFVDLLTKRGLRVRYSEKSCILRLSRSCRDVSFAGQSFALADATVKNGTTDKDFVFEVGDQEFAFQTYDEATRELVVDGLRLLVERAVSDFFTSDEFRVRRARRRAAASSNTTTR